LSKIVVHNKINWTAYNDLSNAKMLTLKVLIKDYPFSASASKR
jgi:hypothetical protein